MYEAEDSIMAEAKIATGGLSIGLMSDLHLEFEPMYRERIQSLPRRSDFGHPEIGPALRGLKARGIDFLLMPGDIAVGAIGVTYADAVAKYLGCPVYICAGNHDGYRGELRSVIAAFRKAAAATGGRVTFLEMDRANLEVAGSKVAICGTTLWTDYKVNGNDVAAMARAGQSLNDHALIRLGDRFFHPEDALELHLNAMDWLAREVPMAREEADLVICMSHHAPIPDANRPQYRGGDLSPAFVSDLRGQIADWQPDLWVWGHTHFSMRTQIGRTKLVSAQRGYVGVERGADAFTPLVLELAT
jgi:3',5'-cyclic AMP phosphodiesterase CpdA